MGGGYWINEELDNTYYFDEGNVQPFRTMFADLEKGHSFATILDIVRHPRWRRITEEELC